MKDTTTQTGTIYYERVGAGIADGGEVCAAGVEDCRDEGWAGADVRAGANHLTQISIKNNQAQYESFLTLGFGGSGTDLAKHWTITYQGMEQMSDGEKMVQTAKLDLVAKDESTRNTLTHIMIWIDPVQDVSLKQQFFLPRREYPDGDLYESSGESVE